MNHYPHSHNLSNPTSYEKELDELSRENERLKSENATLKELLSVTKLYLDSGDYEENKVQYLLCQEIEQALKETT